MEQAFRSRFCVLCHGAAESMCLRCRDPYCSIKCQKMDWPQHKSNCFPMPMLVCLAPEENDLKSSMNSPITPPSPIKALQNSKMTTSNVGLNNDISGGAPLANKENNVNFENYSQSITNCVGKISMNDKPDGNNSTAMYFKSHKIDATDMRRPKIPVISEPMRLPNKTVSSQSIKSTEIPMMQEKTVDKPKVLESTVKVPKVPEKPVEVPKVKQKTIEIPMRLPNKTVSSQPVKSTEIPMKPEKTVDVPKVLESTVEVPKVPEKPVEVPKVKEKTIEVPKISELKLERIEPPAMSLDQPWMKSFPMEENEFESVVVQYVSPDNTTWVMHEKNEGASNHLLCEINKTKSKASTPVLKEIVVNSMFSVPFEEIYYRAIILEPVSATGTVLVRLIDYGNEVDVPIDELKSPIPVMATLNAYSFPIKFRNPRKTEIGDKMKVKMELIKDDVVIVIVEGETTLITIKDIEVVPLPIGAKKNLFCLDFSNIPIGYISACVYDERAIRQTEEIGAKITDYCKLLTDGYCPRVDELCLTLFEDGQWYRTVVLEVKDANTFDIIFIDYGNTATVNSSSIRKMSKEFMHKCLMNKCYIKGFPKKPSKDDIQKMALFFNDNQIFEVEPVQMENGTYLIEPVL